MASNNAFFGRLQNSVASIAQTIEDSVSKGVQKGFLTGIQFNPAGAVSSEFHSMIKSAMHETITATGLGNSGGSASQVPGTLPQSHQDLVAAMTEAFSKAQVQRGRINNTLVQSPFTGPAADHSQVFNWDSGVAGGMQAIHQGVASHIVARGRRLVASGMKSFNSDLHTFLDDNHPGYKMQSFDPASGKIHLVNSSTGHTQAIPIPPSMQPAADKIKRTAQTHSLIASALQGHASGQGLLAGAAQGAAALGLERLALAVPVVGAASAITAEALKNIAPIRAQGAAYQSIYGGTTAAGLGQSALGSLFGLSESLNLGGANAAAAFQGVSQLGLQGGRRQVDLNNIISMYDKLGVSVKESLALITQASSNGNTSLTGLASAITSVSDAAKTAGMSAQNARQVFSGQVQSFNNSGVPQNTVSQNISALQTNFIQSGGRVLQGVDFSGLNSTTMMQTIGAMTNSSLETVQALASTPGGASAYANQQTAAMDMLAQYAIQMAMPLVMQKIKVWKAMGIDPSKDHQQIAGLVHDILTTDKTGSWAQLCYNAAGAMGLNMTYNQAETWVVMLAINKAEQNGAFSISTANPASSFSGLGNIPGFSTPSHTNVSNVAGRMSGMGGQSTQTSVVKGSSVNLAGLAHLNMPGLASLSGMSSSQQAYIKSGVANSALGALANNSSYASQKFIVQTAQGKREVNFATLAAHYGDQVAAGQVTFATGPHASEEVNSVTRAVTNYNQKVTSNTAQPFQGDQALSSQLSNALNGTITVAPTQALQALLSFGSPNFNISVANSNGTPVSQNTTPGGNPATVGSS